MFNKHNFFIIKKKKEKLLRTLLNYTILYQAFNFNFDLS